MRSEFRGHFFQIPLRILGGFQGKPEEPVLEAGKVPCLRKPHPHPLRTALEAALGEALPLHKARDPGKLSTETLSLASYS